MAEKNLRAACAVLIALAVLLAVYIAWTMSDRAQVSGQQTEVDGSVQNRGDYVDVILSIKNHHNMDTAYSWNITLFYGTNSSGSSSGARIGAGSSLVHVTSFFTGQHGQENTSARIRLYEGGTLIDERIYTILPP